ncbi:MAG TPA: sulfatase-like hydrolase/transferase, partial [bacterium]|nr:sulfatase-like hydrolase/transferase [bacterium]
GAETAEEVNAKVLPWLKSNATRENYYLHINYWDAHRCYKMDASWADRFRDYPVTQSWPDEEAIRTHQSVTGAFTAHRQFQNDTSPHPLMPGAINDRRDFEHMITGYDASIAYVDAHVKQVLDELDRQGVLEDAVIVFSADHGDAFGEHGIYSDHVNVDECIHRIPLIIRWPGVTPAHVRSNTFMYNVDYAPTICDLLGMPIPEDWDGKSYQDNLRGLSGADREWLVWDGALYTVQRAVRTKTHLYIKTVDAWEYNNRSDEELYDMIADPYETTNLCDSSPDVLEQCRTIMCDWIDQQKCKANWTADPFDAILEHRKSWR